MANWSLKVLLGAWQHCSWWQLHCSVHNFLRTATDSPYADLLRYDCKRSLFLATIPKAGFEWDPQASAIVTADSRDVEISADCGIVPSIVQTAQRTGCGAPVEVQDLWKDPRFNRKTDLPCVLDSYKLTNLSLLCVPVMMSTVSGAVLGVVRVYKRLDRFKFGHQIGCASMVATFLSAVLPTYSKLVEHRSRYTTETSCMQRESTRLQEGLERTGSIANSLQEIQEGTSPAKIIEAAEKHAQVALGADSVRLVGYCRTSNRFHELVIGIFIPSELPGIEAVRQGRIIESCSRTGVGLKTTVTLYIPLKKVLHDSLPLQGLLLATKVLTDECHVASWISSLSRYGSIV